MTSRRKDIQCLVWLAASAIALAMITMLSEGLSVAGSSLTDRVNLTGIPEAGTRHYQMTTEVIAIGTNGKRKAPEKYEVWIEYASKPGKIGDVVTCQRFVLSSGTDSAINLPSLKNWTYTFHRSADEQGQIFGIDQSQFEGIKDEKGNPVPIEKIYSIFNTFVDFHSLVQVLAERTTTGQGIQDLHAIGEKIIHESANTKPPLSLGKMVEKGSYFKNGNITLELKGLSMANGRQCALIGYDSGGCLLKMIMKPMPQVVVETNGGSRLFGDIYVDLKTQWAQKATMIEIVVSETSGAMLPEKIQSIHERHILISCLSREEFQESLSGTH